jgi:hypothetical protein
MTSFTLSIKEGHTFHLLMVYSQTIVKKQPLRPTNSGGNSKVVVCQRLIFKVTNILRLAGDNAGHY